MSHEASTENTSDHLRINLNKVAQQQAQLVPTLDNAVDLTQGLDEQETNYRKKNHDLRHKLAVWIFSLLLGWIVLVMVFAFMQGAHRCHGFVWYWSWVPCKFELQTPVIIALFASTTVSIVGLFAIVARWLFNPNKDD